MQIQRDTIEIEKFKQFFIEHITNKSGNAKNELKLSDWGDFFTKQLVVLQFKSKESVFRRFNGIYVEELLELWDSFQIQ